MKSTFFVLLIFFVVTSVCRGRTLSASGVEVRYKYTHQFRSLLPASASDKDSIDDAAEFHAAHLFGLFHSPEGAEAHGYYADLVEGFAGTKHPHVVTARGFRKGDDRYLWVEYQVDGTMLVLKDVVEDWIGNRPSGSVELPLLSDLPAIYSDNAEEYRKKKWKRCTDSHYSTAYDFSYFYDPFRCEELGRSPLAADVKFSVERVTKGGRAQFPQKAIYADNGNGPLTTLYFVAGFDDTPASGSTPHEIHQDAGWKTYAAVERLLTETHGFRKMESLADLRAFLGEEFSRIELLTPVTLVHDVQRRYFGTFAKKNG
ncbi:MAG: hypothetical protein KDD51_13770, partial [Bdellovibrionales bacterium]|nr:hypothetical protein [Bdellovibrionales bacterium]